MAEGINANVSLRRNVVASIGKPGTIGKGDPGTGIVDIEPVGQSADGNIYRIYLSDGTSYDFIAPKGEDGSPGAKGAPGDKGSDGVSPTATVTQTDDGAKISVTDATGTTTATLTNGKDGTPGAKGDKGDKGDTGATGATPNIQIGKVTTLNAGADATASITGTAENPLLNLGIPRGADGTDGGGAGTFRVEVNLDSETGQFTADATFAEILAAYNEGYMPYVVAYGAPDKIYPLRTVSDDQFEFGYARSSGEGELVDSGFYITAAGVGDSDVTVTIPTVGDVLAALPTWAGGSY